ncbi:hypothetical protein [Lentzea sp. NPDC059081]|uniref:hypothetical protein n=1 Tax=Lentzea sp. NPDC059081 TaxID=3346719 RepID=UPI00368B82A3
MSTRLRIAAGIAAAAGLLVSGVPAQAQVETGPWTSYSPSFTVQERGCGTVNDLTFQLTCSTADGDQRAERRYATYSGGTRQFEGSFRITSLGGTRVSLKQTFRESPDTGPFYMLAVERGGRLYAVHGGTTVATGATVGTTVRVNTVHNTATEIRTYINGSSKHKYATNGSSFYDKFGAYRTSSGQGPATVVWSNIKFWRK